MSNEVVDQQIVKFDPNKTKAEMQLVLTKAGLAYQKLLQDGEAVVFTKENLNADQVVLKTLRTVKKKLEDVENPYTESWKGFNQVKKELVDPIVALLTKKEGEYKKLAKEVEEEKARIAQDNARKAAIQQTITDFILTQSQAIAAATTPEEIVAIEKLIGSNKGATNRYQEFLPEFCQRADDLLPLIKAQKEAIKKLADLKKKEEEARKSGDDEAVLQHMEAQEEITGKIEEGKITVQEAAINQAANTSVVVAQEVAPEAPKSRRTVWKAEIVDMEQAVKKSRHLLDITLNSGKVSDSIKTLKESGVFEGKTEHVVNGVRYFEDKSY